MTFKHDEIKFIATTSGRYFSVSLGRLRFLDSAQIMNASLEKLVKNLRKVKFKILRQCMRTDGNEDEERVEMLVRKWVYAYEYVTDERKFEYESLPAPKYFYNRLAETSVSDEDYAHAQNVWTVSGSEL